MISIRYLTFSVGYDNGKLYVIGTPSNLRLILEHIINFAGVQINQYTSNQLIFGYLQRYPISYNTFASK